MTTTKDFFERVKEDFANNCLERTGCLSGFQQRTSSGTSSKVCNAA